ncbi:hypothetical protein SSBR45G_33610 [Bradyrhizobium sp. SSBR45G]|uniref:hypothetical protein n=1 Tax=unclassified Bradyrhizobium TaxID=2631580 RepID=UPI002342B064|nr:MULTISPECIES: hypothetical protein [unclassified Bradyrhizobium]GLH78452.1 hypothetical protein SSBR45G_33610 [Bradyrhizobium sp. SSBR45G]GLH86235.1 hypothetical protein SSBR45R_36950 [Bradyrhizobium sp. SSBR45R]
MGARTNAALVIASLIVFVTSSVGDIILAAEPQTSASTADEQWLFFIVGSRGFDRRKILNCGDDRTLFDRDGMWGIRDADGHEIIAPRYRALDCFKSDTIVAAIDERRQWCALAADGTPRDPSSCSSYYSPVNWTHTRQQELDKDPYESSVLWARARLEFGAGKRDRPPQFESINVNTF